MEKAKININWHLHFSPRLGFTLIELLVVMAIIGTLAGIAIPLFASYMEKAKITRAIADIRTIEKEILASSIEDGSFPNDLDEIGYGSLRDPWGNPYQYTPVEGTPKGKLRKDHFMVPVNTDFDLFSMGPDGGSAAPFTAKASRDDIVRANDGQFVGSVSQY